MWKYLSKEDVEYFKGKVSKEFYYKLQHQAIKRIPMLKTSYESLKKKYGN